MQNAFPELVHVWLLSGVSLRCSAQDKQTSLNHCRNHRCVVRMLQKLRTVGCKRESQIKVFQCCRERSTAEKTFASLDSGENYAKKYLTVLILAVRSEIFKTQVPVSTLSAICWLNCYINYKRGCKTINCNLVDGPCARSHDIINKIELLSDKKYNDCSVFSSSGVEKSWHQCVVHQCVVHRCFYQWLSVYLALSNEWVTFGSNQKSQYNSVIESPNKLIYS